MVRYARLYGLQILLFALSIIYASLLLTNGSLQSFFIHNTFGSQLYANVWEHLLQGNFFIDKEFASNEYYLVGPEKFVTYFGIMPSIIRGIASLFVPVYQYNLANLSMVTAFSLQMYFVLYALTKLSLFDDKSKVKSTLFCIAIILASPLCYLLAWGWIYHEVILWGYTWVSIFISIYCLWIFSPASGRKPWHSLVMAISLGLAFLTRPSLAIIILPAFFYLCIAAWYQWHKDHHNADIVKLRGGLAVCIVLGLITMWVNYSRWGNPLVFMRYYQHAQASQLSQEQLLKVESYGQFNTQRLPTSFLYYFVPNADNIRYSLNFPGMSSRAVKVDSQLRIMENTYQMDYIEGSRVPLTLSATFLLVVAMLGVYNTRFLSAAEKRYVLALCAGGLVTAGLILTMLGVALRYSVEFLPLLVFFVMIYLIVYNRRKKEHKYTDLVFLMILVISVYLTTMTMFSYKQFIWDIPKPTRDSLRLFLHHTPADTDKMFIINGKNELITN